MTVVVTLFNGFCLGIEKTNNNPMWADFGDGYSVVLHSGLTISLGFLRIKLGAFDELMIGEFEEEQ